MLDFPSQQAEQHCKHKDVQEPNNQIKQVNKQKTLNLTLKIEYNYELIKWVPLLGHFVKKKKFIALKKAAQFSVDMEIIYCFLPLSKKCFMVSSSFHLLLRSGNWVTAAIYRY